MPGEVFTSPTPDQMYEAAKKVHGGSGVLLIVKNYAGDVMNFDLAADLLRADGIAVESVLIADDVAVESSLYSQGRRGTGTTVLAEKILGAAAERGYSLEQLAALGRRIADNGRSMGLALTSCTVPHVGKPTFELGPDEVEIGIGIHGEPGRFREPLRPADELVERLMGPILDDLPFQSGDRVICLVNSMGGTPCWSSTSPTGRWRRCVRSEELPSRGTWLEHTLHRLKWPVSRLRCSGLMTRCSCSGTIQCSLPRYAGEPKWSVTGGRGSARSWS